MLKRGEVEIQDEGSQLVALLVDAKPGERVVDFCAGAGGKRLALATQTENKGHVVACDVSKGRLKRAAARARGAGLHNIETRLLSSETDRWENRRGARRARAAGGAHPRERRAPREAGRPARLCDVLAADGGERGAGEGVFVGASRVSGGAAAGGGGGGWVGRGRVSVSNAGAVREGWVFAVVMEREAAPSS